MINVISLFGLQDVQDAMIKKFRNPNIHFYCKDCASANTMLFEIEKSINDLDVAVISNSILHNSELENLLIETRKISTDLRIILIISGARKQFIAEQLVGYKHRFKIKDILFEERGVNTDELEIAILRGRLTENESIIMAEVESEYLERNVDTDCRAFGIFGTTHGTGVTNMVVSFAEYFAAHGRVVKAVDLTGTGALSFVKDKTAIYISQKYQNTQDAKKGCEILIYDFGTPFNISPKGDFSGINYSQDIAKELRNCDLKVAIGFSDEWHINKSLYFFKDEKWSRFIDNTYVFLFDKEPKKIAELNKYTGEINIMERNDNEFINKVTKLFLNGGENN